MSCTRPWIGSCEWTRRKKPTDTYFVTLCRARGSHPAIRYLTLANRGNREGGAALWPALPPRGRLHGALVGRRRTLKQPTPHGHEEDGPIHPKPRRGFLALGLSRLWQAWMSCAMWRPCLMMKFSYGFPRLGFCQEHVMSASDLLMRKDAHSCASRPPQASFAGWNGDTYSHPQAWCRENWECVHILPFRGRGGRCPRRQSLARVGRPFSGLGSGTGG